MQQILQNLSNGQIARANIPTSRASAGHLLVRTRTTLISSGTERMLLDFGKANWIEKARSQPDKVRMVLEKFRTDGIAATVESVRAKLDQPLTLGYSNVGTVLEAGSDTPFKPGDRVVSNGNHAEIVHVPKNFCARIPDSVSDESAVFTVLGAIALEGIRLAQPTLGEYVVVTGLGLVGLLTVQLLRANGCQVLGIDFDPSRLRLAESFGATIANLSAGEDPVVAAERFSRGAGVDAVLITAATKSNEPVHQAALMCRKRGRVVLVGVTGLQLSRDDFYKKELSFQVSCSYGPGRYDESYEQHGQDYPQPYVRWTSQRNFEAVLALLADGRLDASALITHRFPFEAAEKAYDLIQSPEQHLGVLLQYGGNPGTHSELLARTITLPQVNPVSQSAVRVGFIGAGAYANKVLLPAFHSSDAALETVVSAGGVSAAHAARRFGFRKASTDSDALMADPSINTIVIATRHNSHAAYVREALVAGKNVFVEKPLALTAEQLDAIEADYMAAIESGLAPRVMVGFNRRFAPHVTRMKALVSGIREPKTIIITVNAGRLPGNHWTLDPDIGGGRILGEACHFVDVLRFLTGAQINSVQGTRTDKAGDTTTINLSFEDGSLGTIHYIASGHKAFPKERIDLFCAGRVLQLDNYRKLRGWGWPRFKKMSLWRQDKGARQMVQAFVRAVKTGAPSPIPFDEILEVSRATIQAASL